MILDELASEIIKGKIKDGNKVKINLNTNQTIALKIAS
jgi:hypothetical protein